MPVVIVQGGSPLARQDLIRKLDSLEIAFRLVELGNVDPQAMGDLDGDVAKFLEDFSMRMLTVTKKDWDVLRCVLEGNTNKSIAAQLDLSERSIELRKACLMKKLNSRSHTELVRKLTKFLTLIRYASDRANGEASVCT